MASESKKNIKSQTVRIRFILLAPASCKYSGTNSWALLHVCWLYPSSLLLSLKTAHNRATLPVECDEVTKHVGAHLCWSNPKLLSLILTSLSMKLSQIATIIANHHQVLFLRMDPKIISISQHEPALTSINMTTDMTSRRTTPGHGAMCQDIGQQAPGAQQAKVLGCAAPAFASPGVVS